jgi:hypothetical protein
MTNAKRETQNQIAKGDKKDVAAIVEQQINDMMNTRDYQILEQNTIKAVLSNKDKHDNDKALISSLWLRDDNKSGILYEASEIIVNAFEKKEKAKLVFNKLKSIILLGLIESTAKGFQANDFNKAYLKSIRNKMNTAFKAIVKLTETNEKNEAFDYYNLNKEFNQNECKIGLTVDKLLNILYAFGWSETLDEQSNKEISDNIDVFNNALKELNSIAKSEKEVKVLTPMQLKRRAELGLLSNAVLVKEFINKELTFSNEMKTLFVSLQSETLKAQAKEQKEENNRKAESYDSLKAQKEQLEKLLEQYRTTLNIQTEAQEQGQKAA